MAIDKNKPDLFTVLRRRKRSVAVFLEETGIKDLSSLATLVRSLENVYIVSNQFMREANAYILCVLSNKKALTNLDNLNNIEHHTEEETNKVVEENLQNSKTDSVNVKKTKITTKKTRVSSKKTYNGKNTDDSKIKNNKK